MKDSRSTTKRENDGESRKALSTRDNKIRFNTYRERTIENEEISFNEEESSILNDSFSVERESEGNLGDNEIDEKDVFE